MTTQVPPDLLQTPFRKNAIINGNFDVWQRGTSQTADGYGSADRWLCSGAGSTKTMSRQTFTPGQTDVPGNPKYYYRTVETTPAVASNYVYNTQRIESVLTFAGETCTLSFWAKADATKDIAIDFVQNFGNGGSPSATVTEIGVTTFTLTTAWQKFTTTITMPSISGKTLGTNDNTGFIIVGFWLSAGSDFDARTNSLGTQDGTFDFAQVQVEKGDVATEFEVRHIGEELALCYRYCWVAAPHLVGPRSTTSSIAVRMSCTFPVEMRAAPTAVRAGTVVLSDGSSSRNSVTMTSNTVSTTGASLQFGCDGAFASIACAVVTVPSSAWYITFDAEL